MYLSNPLACLLLASVLSGCGAIGGRYVHRASADSYGGGSVSAYTVSGTVADYNCPSSPNVVPDYDYNHDGSAQYTVCTHKSAADKILLHGQTHSSDTYCLFPAQYVDAQHIYLKPDLKTGAPLVTCLPTQAGAGYAEFPGVNYNALFIVEGPDKDAMQSCLIGGNYFACPHYSWGRFR